MRSIRLGSDGDGVFVAMLVANEQHHRSEWAIVTSPAELARRAPTCQASLEEVYRGIIHLGGDAPPPRNVGN